MISEEKLIELGKKYGTPLFVYDADLILQRFKELHKFISYPKLRIYYAMKANYSTAILNLLKENGAFIDAVSPAEILLCLKLGFKKEQLLFTANNLTEFEMFEVKKTGVLFNIDSLSRLEKFGKAFPKSEICLRFNPDVVAGEFAKIQTGGNLTKFGILLKDVKKVLHIVEKHELKVIGLHEHTGSGISEENKIYESIKNLLSIASKENFPYLEFIDFGGGFKVPYKENEKKIDYASFGKKVSEIFTDFCKKYGKELYLYFEPGKFIVAESGYLIVQVNTLKDNNARLIAGTNSGFPQLIRPMFYGAYHQIINLSNQNGKLKKYDVAGNICETGDNFATDRLLPEIRENDFLAVKNAGAYCYSMGGNYNLRAMPSEVIVLNKKDFLTRKALSNQELANQIFTESRMIK